MEIRMVKRMLARRALRRAVRRSFADGVADQDWGAGVEPLWALLRELKYGDRQQLEDAGLDA